MSARGLTWTYTSRYKWLYLAGFLCLITASVVVMLPPLVLRDAIDSIDEGSASRWGLAKYGAIILGLAVVESFTRFGSRLLVSGSSRKVEYDMRNALAEHEMLLDQDFYLRSQTGDLMARATNDLQVVRDLMGPTLLDLARVGFMLAFGFVFLLSVNLKLALIAFAYFPIVSVLIITFANASEKRYFRVQEQFGVLSNRVQENISGMRTIKAYAQEDVETESFAKANREMMRRSMSWAYFTGALFPLMTVATGASTLLVLWFGGHDVVSGEITLGQFVQFNSYLIILANPLMSLGWTATTLQQGIASLRRIGEIFAATPAIADPATAVTLDPVRGDVSFRNVSFGYGAEPVLRDISLEIKAGTTVALVGATGSGKTTLVNLLVRLHDPQEGAVLLDGVDVRQLSLKTVREAVGFVPQETFLFSEPLSENIAYGRPNPHEGEIEYALTTSQLSKDLPQLTHGIDTMIGERGVTLSGGQKQRAALARAIIKDPPVMVLDDALSHVDTHTEEEILHRLHAFMEKRTTIIVAHRTSTVASADRIIVLEEGRIAEEGSHAELLILDRSYAKFFRRQLLAEQVEEDEAGEPGHLDESGSAAAEVPA